MKSCFTVVSMVCLFALADIVGATAQETQKANPPTDFKYDLNETCEGVTSIGNFAFSWCRTLKNR